MYTCQYNFGLGLVILGILFEDTDLQPPNSLHLTSSIGIILEGQVVMDKMQDLLQAICLLFGLIYALDLNYPKSLANTFDFIQRVLMSMGQNALKPRVQSLANQLFALETLPCLYKALMVKCSKNVVLM
uniref:Uncharacterized protein n=1 Tax=Sinocyclocheilus anshuiensis TaxID=1608454 RepID=A0A671KFT6_9TELE